MAKGRLVVQPPFQLQGDIDYKVRKHQEPVLLFCKVPENISKGQADASNYVNNHRLIRFAWGHNRSNRKFFASRVCCAFRMNHLQHIPDNYGFLDLRWPGEHPNQHLIPLIAANLVWIVPMIANWLSPVRRPRSKYCEK